MVEATEGCDINQGKCAKRVKSTKFVKQIYIAWDFETREKFINVSVNKILIENFNFLSLPLNFHSKRQGEGGWCFFFKKNVFIALIA
jgi:hypothetical protein